MDNSIWSYSKKSNNQQNTKEKARYREKDMRISMESTVARMCIVAYLHLCVAVVSPFSTSLDQVLRKPANG